MGNFVHLAREFFNEGEMRDIFSAESYFSINDLYAIAHDRGIILSESLSREQLVNELGRYWYSWRQFQHVVRHLNSEDQEEKTSVIRVKNRLEYEEVEKAQKTLVAKRTAANKGESYKISKISDAKVRIVATYVIPDPTKAKGLQRQEKVSIIEIDLNTVDAEILHGRDDRSAEIAYSLLSCLREGRKDPDELIEQGISLKGITNPADRSKFFTKLITLVRGCILLKVKDVRLEKFKPAPDTDDEDDDLKDGEISVSSERERETAGRIESALFHGDDVLVTKLYNELSEDGYFISYLRWEVREKGGTERRVVFEGGFKDPQNGQSFYFDAKKFYEKTDFGEDVKNAKNTKALDRSRFRRDIADAAFKAVEYITKSKENQP